MQGDSGVEAALSERSELEVAEPRHPIASFSALASGVEEPRIRASAALSGPAVAPQR